MTQTTREKRITIAEIAKLAGVSTSTVSSFLNDREYGIRIGIETQRKIMETCRRLNYRPKNEYAMRKLYPQMGNTCFLMNAAVPGGIQHQYFGKILNGIVSSLTDTDQSVSYSLFDPDADYEANPERLPQLMRNGSCSRFIAASSPNHSLVRQVLKCGLPFVYLGHVMDLPGLSCIVPDYAEATRKAVAYLASMGHEYIAYLTGPFGERLYNKLELEEGFSDGLKNCNIPLRPQYIFHCPSRFGEFPKENLIEAADHLMKLTPRPTAILCFHDTVAVTISSYLQSKGFKVPEDISIMGCNDEPSAALHNPPLTTIRFPLEEMGKRAMEEIDKQVNFGSTEHSNVIKLPVQLIERESCAPPAKV